MSLKAEAGASPSMRDSAMAPLVAWSFGRLPGHVLMLDHSDNRTQPPFYRVQYMSFKYGHSVKGLDPLLGSLGSLNQIPTWSSRVHQDKLRRTSPYLNKGPRFLSVAPKSVLASLPEWIGQKSQTSTTMVFPKSPKSA